MDDWKGIELVSSSSETIDNLCCLGKDLLERFFFYYSCSVFPLPSLLPFKLQSHTYISSTSSVLCCCLLSVKWAASLQPFCPLLSQTRSPDSFLLAWLCISAAAGVEAKPQAQNPLYSNIWNKKASCLEVAYGEQWCKQTERAAALITSSVVFDFLDHGMRVCGEEGVSLSAQWKVSSVCLSLHSFGSDSSCPLVCNIFSVHIHLSVVYSSSVSTQHWAESLLGLNW